MNKNKSISLVLVLAMFMISVFGYAIADNKTMSGLFLGLVSITLYTLVRKKILNLKLFKTPIDLR